MVVRDLPESITVSATDAGEWIRWRCQSFQAHFGYHNRLAATTRGAGQPNGVVTLKVSEFTGVLATEEDASGNRAHLPQVDLRPSQSAISCL